MLVIVFTSLKSTRPLYLTLNPYNKIKDERIKTHTLMERSSSVLQNFSVSLPEWQRWEVTKKDQKIELFK